MVFLFSVAIFDDSRKISVDLILWHGWVRIISLHDYLLCVDRDVQVCLNGNWRMLEPMA